jgi:antitoxin YefM
MYKFLYKCRGETLGGRAEAKVRTMRHVRCATFRANLASYLEEVCRTRAPLLVTRQKAGSVVVLAHDEYEALMESLHLLRSPANASHLLQFHIRRQCGWADQW